MAAAGTTAAMERWPRLLVLALAAALLAARVDGATASAPAPAPSAYCTDALLSLAGCLGYVQAGSTEATPDPTCCSGLKDVVRTQVACLCQAFQSGQDFGVSLNMTKALQLPAACKVKTPPASKCNVSLPGVPSASPVAAPSAGAPSSDQATPPSSTPSISGSPAAAATGSDSGTPAPAPARSGAAGLSASSRTFFAAATAAAILLMYRVV
ncbi:hypothetical protein BS78_01G450900 [Paspalum vaginatum]|nr:hypothetical protein BS78_01G450900 [Paspalum vaginatum]